MAKRVRGSTTRPGQRARLQRSTPSRPVPTGDPAPRPAGLTTDEEARAAELEAQIVAEEKASDQAASQARERGRRAPSEAPVRTGTLAAEATEEYAYVARDVRRIAIVGGSLVGLLLGLWIVVQVTGAGPL
jgi:hypothetical protein